MIETVELKAGKKWQKVKLRYEGDRIFMTFPYNKALLEEVRAMQHRRWDPDTKSWHFPATKRNLQSLDYLRRDRPNPFLHFSQPIVCHDATRDLWDHQQDMFNFIMTRHFGILAAQMGTGKSLVIIEAMEASNIPQEDIWYVSTKGALVAMQAELKKWKSNVLPQMMTFQSLAKKIGNWTQGDVVPRMLIGDESSRWKSHKAQRTVAAQNLADVIRETYGLDGYVIESTGTPAPKNPTDWWSQIEIAAPGFLKDGSTKQLETRLAHIEYIENDAGQSFPKIMFWWDDPKRCLKCGGYPNDEHDEHRYQKSRDELSRLANQIEPVAKVVLKSEVLSYLPDKHYRILTCDVNDTILESAKSIRDLCESPADALIKLRALSDGFQYIDKVVGKKTCTICKGSGTYADFVEDEEREIEDWEDTAEYYGELDNEADCFMCQGTGKQNIVKRDFISFPCPKYQILDEILTDHQEDGRLIIYASFRASIDKIQDFCLTKQWHTFVVDGRGWRFISPSQDVIIDPQEMLEAFQDSDRKIGKIVFIAHPKSGGMGLTLTEANEEVFFSNGFDGEDRQQAEDRAHRPGMDLNKGLTITDIDHLPTDRLTRANLLIKKKLQAVTMKDIDSFLQAKEQESAVT